MSDSGIPDLLQRLHGALEKSNAISDEDRKLLRQLSLDIHELLDKPGGGIGAERSSLLGRLRDAILRLEVSHPHLTETLGTVSKQLADMGI
jgi:hypothetical protein